MLYTTYFVPLYLLDLLEPGLAHGDLGDGPPRVPGAVPEPVELLHPELVRLEDGLALARGRELLPESLLDLGQLI